MVENKFSISDAEIIARDERSHRAIVIAVASFFVLLVVAVLLFLAGSARFMGMGLVNLLVVALLLGWILFIFVRVQPGIAPSGEAFDEDYLRKTVDLQHRRWRYTIIGTLFGLCVMADNLTLSFLRANDAFARGLISPTFGFIALLAVLTVSFGPGFFLPYYRKALNDELMRTQQSKVARLGYIIAITEMCAVLVIASYRPQWGIATLPVAVAAAITLPGFYFLFLDWRANRSG